MAKRTRRRARRKQRANESGPGTTTAADEANGRPPLPGEGARLTNVMLAALAQSVTRKQIRLFLVEITKQRAVEVLDLYAATDRDSHPVTLTGVTRAQVRMLRAWITAIVAPELIAAYGKFLQDGSLPAADPFEQPAAVATTLSLAVDGAGKMDAKWGETSVP